MAYGYIPPTPAWQPPKTTAPKTPTQPQYGSNTNWASGATAWDPKNTFTAPNPVSGMETNPTPAWNMQMRQGPTAGMTTEQPNTQVATAMPYAGGFSFMDSPPQNQNVATPMPSMGQGTGLLGNMPQQPQGQNPSAFNTQYATQENLQPYMNPFLDQIIARGNKAIESSAAARGGLLSSRTGSEMGDWTTNAQIGAHQEALGAFNADRGYMTDNYWKNRFADTADSQYANNFDWDMYKYGNGDYLSRLLGGYNQNQGLVNTGIAAGDNSGAIQMNLAKALAELYGSSGDVKAAELMGSNSQQNGLLGGILGMFLGGG